MKILLCQDVEKLGWYGDVVDVKDGYARNYLIPQGVAIVPSENKIRAMAEEKATRATAREKVAKTLAGLAQKVQDAEVVIAAKTNEQGHLFGSISEKDIAQNLRDQGYDIKDSYVKFDEHVKDVGEYEIILKFAAEISATVKLTVVAEGAEDQAEQDVELADESVEETTE